MNRCEDGCGIDDAMELPPPVHTITNSTYAGQLAIESALREDSQDFVSALPHEEAPLPNAAKLRDDRIHGAYLDDLKRWCACCSDERPEINRRQELKCDECGAPWDRPVTEAA